MKYSFLAHKVDIETYDQYRVKVVIDGKKDDFKKSLYFILKTHPVLWKALEKIRDSLDNEGIE